MLKGKLTATSQRRTHLQLKTKNFEIFNVKSGIAVRRSDFFHNSREMAKLEYKLFGLSFLNSKFKKLDLIITYRTLELR